MIVEVRPSGVSDIYKLASRLREADADEARVLGIDPTVAIRRSYRNGILRRSYFVDGELAAMSGLGGSLLDDIGAPWLMTTAVVERVPVAFVKVARAQVAVMLQHRMRLENVVAASYTGACRLLQTLGFTLDEPQPLGPHGAQFRKFWMVR